MRAKMKLKMFKRTSIVQLKRMYNKSKSYIFDNDTWRSTSNGEFKVLLHTRKSLKRFGDELSIFKAPTIVGLKIIYHKSMEFLFDHTLARTQIATVSEDNYLYRDLSNPVNTPDQIEKELKIFIYPTIENLKSLYYKSIGKK